MLRVRGLSQLRPKVKLWQLVTGIDKFLQFDSDFEQRLPDTWWGERQLVWMKSR